MKKYIGYGLSALVVAAFAVYFWLTGQNNGMVAVQGQPGDGTSTSTDQGQQNPSGTPVGIIGNPDIGNINPGAGGGTNSGGTGSTGGTGTGTPPSGPYKDGTYTGPVTDAIYGQIQVVATIQGGKLTRVGVPVFPNAGGHTTEVTQFSIPQLKQEAIAAQSANVDIVSGATQTSQAFEESLAAALAQAHG